MNNSLTLMQTSYFFLNNRPKYFSPNKNFYVAYIGHKMSFLFFSLAYASSQNFEFIEYIKIKFWGRLAFSVNYVENNREYSVGQ